MLLKEYIGIEQSRALARLTPAFLISMVLVGIVTVGVLAMHFSLRTLSLWFISVCLVVVGHWFASQKLTPEHIDESNYHKHLSVFTLTSLINGLLWGSVAFLFHDPETPIYSLYLVFVITGYVSIAGSTTSLYQPVFFAFSIPAITLFALRFVIEGGDMYRALAVTAVFYLLVMTALTRVMQSNFKSAKGLEYENQSLLRQVTDQKNFAETAVVEKNHFLAATSHDLRQPLHAMNLYIDALRPRLANPTDADILEKIALSGNALNDLLHGLLDISRLDASVVKVRPQHVVFATIANHLKEEFSPQTEDSNLQLIVDADEQHIVYADPVLLERVIRNLLSNAVKYTRKGHVKLTSSLVDSNIEITVSDTGIGVPSGKINEIFLEFTQIGNSERDRSKGLGLGLSIVKRLCDLQNIEMLFTSRLGHGTQVHLIVKRGDPALLPMPFSSTHNDFEYLTILCIDDEEAIRDAMQMIIRSWKCRPIVASDGPSALETVRELDISIDIIISDLRLRNEESGIDVIKSIREELNEEVPAIVITGDTAVDRIELVNDAAVVVLHKPINTADLRRAIEQLLKHRSG